MVPSTSSSIDGNNISLYVIIPIAVVLFVVLVIVIGLILYTRRRQPSTNNGKQEEESLDLMQDNTKETARIEEKPACLFDQAKMFLVQKKMVVITGVPGSGKTFLAKSLVNELHKNGYKMKSVLICNLDQLQQGHSRNEDQLQQGHSGNEDQLQQGHSGNEDQLQQGHSGNEDQLQQGHSGNEDQLQRGPGEQENIYIIDDIFHELQKYDQFAKTLTALNEFLSHAGETYFIITIPSCTWVNNCEEFDYKFFNVQINLDKRNKREKFAILQSLQKQNDFSNDQLANRNALKNEILLSSFACIGFPAIVSLMFKQTNVEQLEKCLCDPLKMVRDEISSIKNGTIKEKGQFLVLTYICSKDGKIDVQNVDENLFNVLKNRYAPKFDDKNLAEYCNGMVGHYLLSDTEGCYEVDLNIIKKTVCDSMEEDNCINEYLKHNLVKALF